MKDTTYHRPKQSQIRLCDICLEGARAVGHKCRASLCDAMRQRELEVGDKQLFDVWSAHIFGLLDLYNTDDLIEL